MKKIIKLPCFNIEVILEGKGGTITSSGLCDLDKNSKEYPPLPNSPFYTSYIFAEIIESMILAHAIAGVDIEHFAYIEGIETAIDAFFNHF